MSGCTPTGSEVFFTDLKAPWRYQICISKCLYYYRDELSKNWAKKPSKNENKKTTSGWRASIKNVFAHYLLLSTDTAFFPALRSRVFTVISLPGEGNLYNGLSGEAPPERSAFFRLQVCERVGKSIISVWKGKKCLTDVFYSSGNWKRENVLVLWFIHILKSAHLQ